MKNTFLKKKFKKKKTLIFLFLFFAKKQQIPFDPNALKEPKQSHESKARISLIEREANIMRQLKHANIVEFYGYQTLTNRGSTYPDWKLIGLGVRCADFYEKFRSKAAWKKESWIICRLQSMQITDYFAKKTGSFETTDSQPHPIVSRKIC